MFRIESKVSTNSPEFKENEQKNREQHRIFKEKLERVKLGGPEKSRQRHVDRK